jgi:hypothetical protein
VVSRISPVKKKVSLTLPPFAADLTCVIEGQGAASNTKSKPDGGALIPAIGQADGVRLPLSKRAEVNAKNEQGHTASER